MGKIRPTTVVKKGAIFPSTEDVKKVVAKLRRELKDDPRKYAKFKRNPRAFLGALGLAEDVQNELINDMGLPSTALCIFTNCIHTCWFTKCVLTKIVIKREE
jgi:hypothetical protein